ncbi:MAG: RnfABCDGE type electron transport complex subunit D [Candidatus Saccharimonadales bacterium]
MFNCLDKFLDKITIYRLVLYYLGGLLAVAIVLSATGIMQYNPLEIIVSTLFLAVVCWIVNKEFSYVVNTPANSESWLITALILALIITPRVSFLGLMFTIAAAGLAMASKYVLTIKNTHIFNPVAIAVVLTALGPRQVASWWVGTAVLLPFVVIGGVLLVQKIRRWQMVGTFLITTFAATVIYTLLDHGNVLDSLLQAALTSPVFFIGFIMLTEPVTSPSTRGKQTWYAVLVGALLPPQVHIFGLYSTPELSLVIGNVFSAIVSPKARVFPVLKEKLRLTANTIDFVFSLDKKLSYQAGQYMEWTLPHKGVDSRGNRRYFTLASSPTESDLHLGVKFYDEGSSYKKALLTVNQGTHIVAAQVAGDFTLPKNPRKKLVFIAGGIGVTPFRSMLKYLLDKNETRDIVLLYMANSLGELAYKDVLEVAHKQLGVKVKYIVANLEKDSPDDSMRPGLIDAKSIKQLIPDYHERIFYLSGSHTMVTSVQANLAELKVTKRRIKIDYFPGYQ